MVRDTPSARGSVPTGRRLTRTPYVTETGPPGRSRRLVLRLPNTMLVVGLAAALFALVTVLAFITVAFVGFLALISPAAVETIGVGPEVGLSTPQYLVAVAGALAWMGLAWLLAHFILSAFDTERTDSTWRDDVVIGIFYRGLLVAGAGIFLLELALVIGVFVADAVT